MILHLGVVDLPYADKGSVTTGQVAGYLEDKYHIIEVFYESNADKIGEDLKDALEGALENMLMGAPVDNEGVFNEGTSKVKKAFTVFLSSAEIETMGIPGVPTKAALGKRSLRFKSRKAKVKRPSFIDTGLYQTSFIAWVDDTDTGEAMNAT